MPAVGIANRDYCGADSRTRLAYKPFDIHGALAQSEAYRLHATAERLTVELKDCIDRIVAAAKAAQNEVRERMAAAVKSAVALIMEEHQDWQMLVRPHHLPLA